VTLALPMAVVAVTGFIALSYEILWFRAISFVTGGAPAAFGLLLGFYPPAWRLVPLGVGSSVGTEPLTVTGSICATLPCSFSLPTSSDFWYSR